MSTPAKITPFPPGHFEEFTLKLTGKVESCQMVRFHCCTDEPKHASYNKLQGLATGRCNYSDVKIVKIACTFILSVFQGRHTSVVALAFK